MKKDMEDARVEEEKNMNRISRNEELVSKKLF